MSAPVLGECQNEPVIESYDAACFTMALHYSHPPACIPFLAASAYVTEHRDAGDADA